MRSPVGAHALARAAADICLVLPVAMAPGAPRGASRGGQRYTRLGRGHAAVALPSYLLGHLAISADATRT